MPKRTDIHSVLIIGAGPIIIGQACEFDYSGTQACKALKEEGYRVILVNSNPATIMTDPEFADRTYIEPITPYFVEKIDRKSTRLNSSHGYISYAVFCLKKKKITVFTTHLARLTAPDASLATLVKRMTD